MIRFTKVRYKNFLAVGDRFIEIDLNRSPSTLVTGHNGAGKTTILEAIVYAMYGKPYRKDLKMAGLINRMNKKGLVCEVEFTIGSKQYKVVRGQKPKVFEIYEDGELIEANAAAKDYQARLESIVGMDYNLFTQIVILNKARFVPFMGLSAPDRRKIVEDILDIGIFSTMNEITKKKLGEVKNEVADLEYRRDMKKKDIDLQTALIERARQDFAGRAAELGQNIHDWNVEREKLNAEYEELEKKREELIQKGTDTEGLKPKLEELKTRAVQFTGSLQQFKKDRVFFDSDSCPTCNQKIAEDLKEEKCGHLDEKITQYEKGIGLIKERAGEITEKLKVLDGYSREAADLSYQSQTIWHNIKNLESRMQDATNQIKKMTEKSDVTENERNLSVLRSELDEMNDTLQELTDSQRALSNVLTILKDNGVKAEIIKQHLPLINKNLNEYLHEMGFLINFFLDENFDADFKNGSADFSYANLSDGQKLRVDLAILLAWIDVAGSKNSANTNLLFLDEILEAMDVDGLQLFFRLVRNKLQGKNLFVISQRGPELQDYFRSEVKFSLQSGYTTIQQN